MGWQQFHSNLQIDGQQNSGCLYWFLVIFALTMFSIGIFAFVMVIITSVNH